MMDKLLNMSLHRIYPIVRALPSSKCLAPREKIPSHKKMSRTESSEEKEWRYTITLFGTNSLKEGAMWRAAESRNI
jgi:hypothetical protein